MAIQNRNYFFTPTPSKERFLSKDEPTERVMRDFAQSVTFKKEVSDTATETQQGLVESATQTEFDNGTDNNSNGFALFVRPSFIKAAFDNVVAHFQGLFDTIQNNVTNLTTIVTNLSEDVESVENQFTESMPVGSVIMYTVGTPPNDKWMLCEGQTLDNTLYPEIFAVIGYTFGGTGVNFSLPDTRKKFIAGFDDGDAEYQNIGQGAGANSVTLTKAQIPTHVHGSGTLGGTTSTDGNHHHSFTGDGDDGVGPNTGIRTTQDDTPSTFDSNWIHDAGNHSHTLNITGNTENGAADGLAGEAHENRPEFITFSHIIKVKN